jgi:hypothetical protein
VFNRSPQYRPRGRNKDYHEVYPEDPYMEEMGENARVWRVYSDEADRIDAEAVEQWKTTLDTLLIFVSISFVLLIAIPGLLKTYRSVRLVSSLLLLLHS